MAKITDLAVVQALGGDETLPMVQDGVTRRVGFRAMAASMLPFLPAAFKGDPGAAGNVAANLVQLKAAPIVADTMLWGGVPFIWETGGAPYTADEDQPLITTVESIHQPLTVGAWIRQGAQSLTFVEAGAGAVKASVDAALKLQPLSPKKFGAKWDGEADDTLAIQKCIDAAAEQGRPVILPGGVAKVMAPIRTYGKMVVISGVAGVTTLRAGKAMRCIIDDVAPGDSYYNPMWISGVVLDGAGLVTEACWSARYRHHVVLDTVWAQNPARTAACFRAQDCWLGRYYNLRTLEGAVAFHAVGANHASTWDSCDFNAVRDIHVLIDNQAGANDGNHGLTFLGCSTEFSMPGSSAVGLRLMDNTSAKWEGGYIGENVTSYVIDNLGGFVVVDGAICFACYTGTNSLVHPYAGTTLIRNGRLADQSPTGGAGLVTLCCNAPDNERGIARGKVRLDDVDIYTPLGGGTRMMNGDFLAAGMPGTNLAKSVGRVYQDLAFGGQTYAVSGGNGEKTLTATNGTSSIMALYAPLARDDFIEGKPVYIAIVYKATQPCVLALTNGPGGAPTPTIGTLPATDGKWCTFVNVLANMEAATAGLQLYMPEPQNGAIMGLRMVTMSDARVSQGSPNGGPARLGHI